MREFAIRLHSVQEVQEFVALATSRKFPITVRDPWNKVDADNFMEMFCLDFTRSLRVVADCTEEELEALRKDAKRFLAK